MSPNVLGCRSGRVSLKDKGLKEMEKEKPTAIFGVGGWWSGDLQPSVTRYRGLFSLSK